MKKVKTNRNKKVKKTVNKKSTVRKPRKQTVQKPRKQTVQKPIEQEKPQYDRQIVKTDCQGYLKGKSFQIKHENSLYITSIFVIEEKLKSLPAHINMGIMTDDGISNDTESWLTVKGKAVYFTPRKNVILIASLSGLQELLSSQRDILDFGIFK